MDNIICLDIGNTRYKIGKFNAEGELESTKTGLSSNAEQLSADLFLYKNDRIIGSDVKGISEKLKNDLNIEWIDIQWKFPFQIDYESVETLGIDRLLNLAGGLSAFNSLPLMVISMGTCITVDILDDNKIFKGGNISPGMKIRYQSIFDQTGNLPLLSYESSDLKFGKNTATSIHTGVQQGILHELNAYTDIAYQSNKNIKIIITGGDAEYFFNRLKRKIFAEPNLTLFGIYSLARKNGK